MKRNPCLWVRPHKITIGSVLCVILTERIKVKGISPSTPTPHGTSGVFTKPGGGGADGNQMVNVCPLRGVARLSRVGASCTGREGGGKTSKPSKKPTYLPKPHTPKQNKNSRIFEISGALPPPRFPRALKARGWQVATGNQNLEGNRKS